MNTFHPLFHETSSLPGSRIDVERLLPVSPGGEDPEDLLDLMSEPPHFLEREAPVRTRLGEEIVRGRNWTDLMIKTYRHYGRMWNRLSMFSRSVLRDVYRERGMLPFTSLCIDPDTLHRIIESDYETGENTYGSLMHLFAQGVLSPCATVPFGVLLPLLETDFERRLVIRMGLRVFLPIIRQYHEFIHATHGEEPFVMLFWLPETAYCSCAVHILCEEFETFCTEEEIEQAHLALLLDNMQASEPDHDGLMKLWNVLACEKLGGREVSVIFRDRDFSEWVSYGCPSVKKLLDRTIAKTDSDLNNENVNYCWGHFEDLEALTHTAKSIQAFEQKILKLTELGYLPLAPDVFIRRKINGKFTRSPLEPRRIEVRDMSAGGEQCECSAAGALTRWLGHHSNGAPPHVAPSHAFTRLTRGGEVEEAGSPCWKIAYNAMRRTVARHVRGDVKTLRGGVVEVLASMLPASTPQADARQAIESFLAAYALIYWREIFIQHDMSEADINIAEILENTLLKGRRKKPSAMECAVASTAAQAFCFMLDAHKGADTRQPNLDQRAVYQNVTMMALALCNMAYIGRWTGQRDVEQAAVDIIARELLDFAGAYARYSLADYGATPEEWEAATASHIEDQCLNVVARAARRVAARHLRPLGYRTEFSRDDESLTTNVGHIWESEIHTANYRWENHYFCGVLEE